MKKTLDNEKSNIAESESTGKNYNDKTNRYKTNKETTDKETGNKETGNKDAGNKDAGNDVKKASEHMKENLTCTDPNCRNEADNLKKENETLTVRLDEKIKQYDEILSALQRTAAEFDNFKKRTIREKESLCGETVCDVAAAFLPVMDNLERAFQSMNGKYDIDTIKEGIVLVRRQFSEAMKNLGIREIECTGKKFDPDLHNAVMHVSDETYGENTIIEELQKGYCIGDRVVRHSVVKVAN